MKIKSNIVVTVPIYGIMRVSYGNKKGNKNDLSNIYLAYIKVILVLPSFFIRNRQGPKKLNATE